MMPWTEAMIRGAASWKAFKEGAALRDAGAVTEAVTGSSGWKGALRSGNRLIRVSVAVKSANDLETRCSCPENRATGELCAHAVAVGLTAIQPKEALPTTPSPSAPAKTALAWDILLAPNWRDSLVRGRLAATLAQNADNAVIRADEQLNVWLHASAVQPKPNLNLTLNGPQAASFLSAIAEHPRIRCAGRPPTPITITQGHRILLADATPDEEKIRLVPGQHEGSWVGMANSWWLVTPTSIEQLGTIPLPADFANTINRLADGHEVRIPLHGFLESLDEWQQWLAIPADSWLDQLHFVPAAAQFELTLDGTLDHLEARFLVKYSGSPAVPTGAGRIEALPRLANHRCEIRDRHAEHQSLKELEAFGFRCEIPATGSWSLRGEAAIVNFLARDLNYLRQRWTITENNRFIQTRKQVAVVTPKIEFSSSGEDWLSFELLFESSDGSTIDPAEVRRLLRSGTASGRVAGGRHLVVANEVAELIDPLFSELDLRQENGRFIAPTRTAELIRRIRDELVHKDSGSAVQSDLTIPPTLRADLRPYQSHGAAWLLDRVKRFGGALLADDMGLGKTLQTIAAIETLFSSQPTGNVLVVATTSLLGNWQAEFCKFAPARRVRILHGSGREENQAALETGEVVLTSYGTLTRDLAWHLKREYLAVIADEASLMRNPDTDHAKALAKLKSPHKIALTGTPLENGVRDLWSIFRFIQPDWLGNRREFQDRYEARQTDGGPSSAVMRRLRIKVSPFLLRRTKEEVAPELPIKWIIDEFCDLSPDQQTVYRDLLHEGRRQVEKLSDAKQSGAARMRMITTLLRLRQTCCDLALLGNDRLNQLSVPRRSSKLQRLLELLEEADSGGHRVLVFSQFRTQLLEIEKCLQERGQASLRLDGTSRNRQQLVDKFQQPDGPPVFLISLKAGGYGLNLTAADTVIHFDPWWNPAAEAQATDRAHRIGQVHPVTVYRLLSRGTVEEKVRRLQEGKRALAAVIDEAGSGDAAGWSLADLESVLVED